MSDSSRLARVSTSESRLFWYSFFSTSIWASSDGRSLWRWSTSTDVIM